MHPSITLLALGLVLRLVTASTSNSCPAACSCSQYVFTCAGKNLTKIPDGIPLSVRKIDLSNNPLIKIEKDAFLRFEHLYALVLKNCSQRDPIYLPKHLHDARFEHNRFTADALTQMLNRNQHSLKTLDLASNNLQPLDVKRILRILPIKLKELHLSGNNISYLTKEDMEEFKEMKNFYAIECSLREIEANIFDKMRNLWRVYLTRNQLTSLPDGLFRFNSRIQVIHLSVNLLETFNASKIGLTTLHRLFLGYNKIKILDVRSLRAPILGLANNRIVRINGSLFENNPHIMSLGLHNNRIEFISEKAFTGIKAISELFLQNNRIKTLPSKLFDGLLVQKIFLQENRFSTLNAVFSRTQHPPSVVILSSNPQLQYLNGTDLDGLTMDSKVYVTCKNLKGIIAPPKLTAKVQCSPSADLVFDTPSTDAFSYSGYECKRVEERLEFQCRACKTGYYSDCDGRQGIEGRCIKCPAGSFYQDQVASTSCKACPFGQYVPPEKSPGKDVSDCRTCPMGTDTNSSAGTRACKCIRGYSRVYRFGACEKCIDQGFDCSQDYQTLGNGYWMTWDGTRSPKGGSLAQDDAQLSQKNPERQDNRTCESAYKAFINNLQITNNSYDRKTMIFDCQIPIPIKCPMPSSCLGGVEQKCSSGYTGTLCAVCTRGYSMQFNRCVQCPEPHLAVLEFIGYIALFILLCLIISWTDKLKTEDGDGGRTFADVTLSCFKILVGFYQVLISILHAFSGIHWPSNLRSAAKVLDYLEFQVIKIPSLRCIKPDWMIDSVKEFWFVLIVTIAVPILALAYFIAKLLYIYLTSPAPSDAKALRYKCGRNCIKIVALFLFVTYPLTSMKNIQMLPTSCHSFCTAKQNNTCLHSLSYLRSDYSVPCLTMAENQATLIAAYIFLAIPLGLPVLLLLLLHKHAAHDENEERTEDADNLLDDPHQARVPVMTSALNFAYENYKVRWWYWEVVEMLRKLIMTTGVVLFLKHTKIGLACTIVLAVLFAVLQAIVKPLKGTFENIAQLSSLIFVSLNLSIGAAIQSKETDSSIVNRRTDSFALGILLVTINAMPVFLVTLRFTVAIISRIISSKIKKSQ